jgi:DNA gyrase subunit A
VAVTNIDEVVQIIRRSKGPDEARGALTARFGLSDIQTQAILDMPLRRLTSLETTRLKEEEKELRARLKVLEALLASEDLRLDAIAEEAADLKARYATPRRSVILDSEDSASRTRAVTEADLRLPAEPQVVILTLTGLERRDAMGFRYAPTEGLTTRTTTCHLAHTRADPADELLLVSSGGRAWRHAVGFIPDKVLFEQLGLVRGERVVHAAVLPADGATCVVLGTRQGRLKRTRVADLATKPGQWFAVMGMEEGDEVALAGVAGDDAEVLFATSQGLVLVTSCGDVNPQASGSARGVAGIGLRADDRVIAGAVVTRDAVQATAVYVVTEEGFAKRVPLGEYPVKGRGSQGVQTVRITPSTGLVAAVAVGPVAAPLDVLFGDGKRFHLPAADVPDENRYNLGKRIIPVWDADGAIVHAAAL